VAAPATPEYQAKVVLMDKLTRFVDWPQGGDPGRPFVLAVLGRTPFGDELDSYFTGRLLKNRPVIIHYLHQPPGPGECDLLFICASERQRLAALLDPLRGQPVLTVADSEGFARGGVMVSLVRQGDRLGFEVNVERTRAAGLRMAPGFLQLATLVQEHP
jgi:hypothetical protein